jgi:AAA domain
MSSFLPPVGNNGPKAPQPDLESPTGRVTAPPHQAGDPPRPVSLGLVAEQIPAALRGWDQWLVWQWRLRSGKDGPYWTKPPLRARDLGQARSTEARDWCSLREALRRHGRGEVDGIGFYPDPQSRVVFGDVDDCRDPATGEIAAWAKPLLARFAFTYQEVSPSGTGVKILLLGAVPGSERRWRLDPHEPLAYVEWFGEGRYTTVTGHRLPAAAADLAEGQAALEQLRRELYPPAPEAPLPTIPTGEPDDLALIHRMRDARDGARFARLFDGGDVGLYGGDESVADLALCGILAYWCGPDPGRIERLFDQSALARRAKWRTRRDYRDRTIAKAISGRTEFWKGAAVRPIAEASNPALSLLRALSPFPPGGHPVPGAEGTPQTGPRRTRWNAPDLIAADLPEPRWAVPDLIPEGLTVLAGRPKLGKSRLALSIALQVASGLPVLGFFELDHGGDVLFCGLEDNERRLQQRLEDLLGKRPPPPTLELWTSLPRLGEGCEQELGSWIVEHPNHRLIVIDTYQPLRRPQTGREGNTYALDYEDGSRLQQIGQLGAVAIVIVLHTRKPLGRGGADPFDEVLGTTGNTAAADTMMVLQTERGRAEAKLVVRGRDVESSEHALETDHVTGGWTRLGDAGDVRRSANQQAILAALRTAGADGLRPVEVARHTGQHGGSVRVLLQRMRNSGDVLERDGRYVAKDVFAVTVLRTPGFSDDDGENTVTMGRNTSATVLRSDPQIVTTATTATPATPATSATMNGSPASEGRSWFCPCGAQVMRPNACPICGRHEGEP